MSSTAAAGKWPHHWEHLERFLPGQGSWIILPWMMSCGVMGFTCRLPPYPRAHNSRLLLLQLLSHVWLFATPWTEATGSSLHGIFQAIIPEWVAISLSRGSSHPRDRTYVSYSGRRILYHRARAEAPKQITSSVNIRTWTNEWEWVNESTSQRHCHDYREKASKVSSLTGGMAAVTKKPVI